MPVCKSCYYEVEDCRCEPVCKTCYYNVNDCRCERRVCNHCNKSFTTVERLEQHQLYYNQEWIAQIQKKYEEYIAKLMSTYMGEINQLRKRTNISSQLEEELRSLRKQNDELTSCVSKQRIEDTMRDQYIQELAQCRVEQQQLQRLSRFCHVRRSRRLHLQRRKHHVLSTSLSSSQTHNCSRRFCENEFLHWRWMHWRLHCSHCQARHLHSPRWICR